MPRHFSQSLAGQKLGVGFAAPPADGTCSPPVHNLRGDVTSTRFAAQLGVAVRRLALLLRTTA